MLVGVLRCPLEAGYAAPDLQGAGKAQFFVCFRSLKQVETPQAVVAYGVRQELQLEVPFWSRAAPEGGLPQFRFGPVSASRTRRPGSAPSAPRRARRRGRARGRR